jgi:hypothetical protein
LSHCSADRDSEPELEVLGDESLPRAEIVWTGRDSVRSLHPPAEYTDPVGEDNLVAGCLANAVTDAGLSANALA